MTTLSLADLQRDESVNRCEVTVESTSRLTAIAAALSILSALNKPVPTGTIALRNGERK